MITIFIIALIVLFVILSVILAIIGGGLMILIKFGWIIITILIIIALIKYLKKK